MYEVKVYDSFGNLKTNVHGKKMSIRSLKQLESASLLKINKRTGKPLENL
jgi:hypothetical protein